MKPVILAFSTLFFFPLLHAQEKPAKKPTAEKKETPQKKSNEPLFTKQYSVPATFFRSFKVNGENLSADLFAPSGKSSELKKVAPDEMLTALGIETGSDGVSAVYNPATRILVLRATEKHHATLVKALNGVLENSEKQIHVIVEFIEVEHLNFSDWLLDNRLNGDATALRKTVQEWLHDKRGTILETSVVTARSGQRAKTESGDEYIYGTETSPPSMPSTLTLGEKAKLPESGPYPAAFETRNLGITLEVDPVLGADATTIDLNLAPEIIKLNGHSELFSAESPDTLKISMPIFHRMKISTQVTTLDGRYVLAGSCRPMADEKSKREDPMVLVFIRGDVGQVGQWSVEEAEAE
ncbi:hypothetical protein N9B73_00625 [Verrucomicrobiales bacterium]|nr:hypothetical protein [Verrucomicrobiales bacterium]